MKDDKKQSQRQEKVSKWRRFAKKRWVYPAIYIGFAALIIAAVLWMQRDSGDYSINEPKGSDAGKGSVAYDDNDKAVPVNQSSEVFKFPVKNKDAVDVQTPFYDYDASTEKQEAALVLHNHTYRPNTGIDIASENGDSFTVTASMSGDVVQAEKDPTLGYVVKIDNNDGVTTLYQSLKDVAVKEGDTVKQGEEIAKAGTSKYNSKAGTHLHFELRKDGKPLNPVEYFKQAKSDLPDKKDNDKKDEGKTDSEKTKGDDNNMNKDQDTPEKQEDKGTSPEKDSGQDEDQTGNESSQS